MEYKHSHYLSNYRHLVPKSYNGLPLTPSAPAPGPLTTRLPGFSQLPLTRELINYTQSHGGSLSIPLTVIDTLFD